jgi:hypothetical protein
MQNELWKKNKTKVRGWIHRVANGLHVIYISNTMWHVIDMAWNYRP